jgi:hypothetical protein
MTIRDRRAFDLNSEDPRFLCDEPLIPLRGITFVARVSRCEQDDLGGVVGRKGLAPAGW